MESRVLRKLNFELAGVTIAHFATEYLAELAITRGDLVQLVYVRRNNMRSACC